MASNNAASMNPEMIERATACAICQSVIQYKTLPGFTLAPTVCGRCDLQLKTAEKRDAANARIDSFRARSLLTLPFSDWQPEKGNVRLLERMRSIANAAHADGAAVSLFVSGETGAGKTRAACEYARGIVATGSRVLYVRAMRAADTYRTQLMADGAAAVAYRDALCDFPGVLIVDDIGAGTDTERSAELWYAVIDARMFIRRVSAVPGIHSGTIITTNHTLDAMAGRLAEYGPRIARRLAESFTLLTP